MYQLKNNLLKRFINKYSVAQILKFGMIGAITALINYLILNTLIEYYFINYLAAITISFIAGNTFFYIFCIFFVFENRKFYSKVTIFIIFKVIRLALNHFTIWFNAGIIKQNNYLLIKKITLIFVTLSTVEINKILAFKC